MKISEVKTYRLRYPLKEKFANSHGWSTTRGAGVVEVRTDDGLVGWGEGDVPSTGDVARCVLGKSPFDYAVIFHELTGGLRGNFRAASAVDIALWDLMGKALEKPVFELLGGAHRMTIPAYASGLFRKDRPDMTAAYEEEAAGYAAAGFPAVKMKVGFGRDYDVKNVAAVRKALGPDIRFAVDANCGYDAATAIDVGRRLAEYDMLWYEEPIPADDVAGYADVKRATGMRIAGGEALEGRRAFRDLIQQRALDVVQPDICIAGGFTECVRVAAMASANYVRVLPHMWGTAIRLAATLHWQATLPDDPGAMVPFPSYFEFDMTENGLRTELPVTAFEIEDGCVPVPEAPGLGVEIRRDVLEKYAR